MDDTNQSVKQNNNDCKCNFIALFVLLKKIRKL